MPAEKFALITGCGNGGIGHALATRLGDEGYTVISTLLPHESEDHLLAKDIKVTRTDVSNDESVLALKRFAEGVTNGKLDILINNAGIAYTMPAVDTDVNVVEKMYAVNVFGPMRMVHHFHRMVIAAKGTIVNVGSIGGITPYVYGSSYNGSKAALMHWGATLRVEMLPFDVQVVNIVSGEVGTNILKNDNFRRLPADSVYAPMSEAFEAHVRRTPGNDSPSAQADRLFPTDHEFSDTITPDQYAAGVVAEITKSRPRSWFWYGKQTTMIWMMSTFLPHTFWDFLFYRMFNLKILAAAVKVKEPLKANVASKKTR